MERLIAVGRFQCARTLQVEARIELVGHANAAMNLNQIIGHLIQERADPGLGQ